MLALTVVAGWLVLSVPFGLLVGRAIRMQDNEK